MELLLYSSIVSLAVLLSLNKDIFRPASVFACIYFSVYLLMTLVVRTSGFDSDIQNYAYAMKSSSLSLYYVREPVVWLGQRYLYSVVPSEIVVFVLFDMFMGYLIFQAFSSFKLPRYAFIAFLAFFPFILGMQNVYRQWVASCFALYALSKSESQLFKFGGAILLSFLSHNVSGIFSPIFTFLRYRAVKSRGFSKIYLSLTGILCVALPYVIYLASGSKSAHQTGANLVIAYLILLMIFLLFFVFTRRGKISPSEYSEYGVMILILYICGLAAFFLEMAGAERAALFALILIYPYIVIRIEQTIRQKYVLRVLLTLCGFLPLFLFDTKTFIFS